MSETTIKACGVDAIAVKAAETGDKQPMVLLEFAPLPTPLGLTLEQAGDLVEGLLACEATRLVASQDGDAAIPVYRTGVGIGRVGDVPCVALQLNGRAYLVGLGMIPAMMEQLQQVLNAYEDIGIRPIDYPPIVTVGKTD